MRYDGRNALVMSEGKDKGYEMWVEVQGLIAGGELKTVEAAE